MQPASSLALGDPVLDRDHDELLRLALALRDASPAQAPAAMEALRAHAGDHFAREDEDIRLSRDPNGQCHLDEHANVLKSFDEVIAVFGNPATPAGTVERICGSLSAELLRWLPEHVSQMDAAVAVARTKRRLGGAPVLISRRAGA